MVVGCWNIVSISLLSEKEGKGESIERGFERRREHEERWRETRGEKERGERRRRREGEKEIVEERDCDNWKLDILSHLSFSFLADLLLDILCE